MAVAIHAVTPASLDAVLGDLGGLAPAYAAGCGFKGEAGQVLMVPAADGTLAAALLGTAEGRRRDRSAIGRLAAALPPGEYRLGDGWDEPDLAALAFRLGGYRFDRYRKGAAREAPRLVAPDGVDADRIALIAGAVEHGRDLINRPANDLGPDALEAAIAELGERRGARVATIAGEPLVAGFPLIAAVGRAAAQAPRLVELTWGDAGAPAVTLVGKGVCFDTGGLDIKPSSAMLLMKKDMGGAAAAIALADMVMGAMLPVSLRLLVPVVENSIGGDSFRPGDVLWSRKGLSVEIGNTDAEGRLILADALSYACETPPDLLLDFATLTGAARVALGPELPPFFTDDDALAAEVMEGAARADDPCWRLPLWPGYEPMLKGKVADLNNAPGGGFAGAITAALFLRRFVAEGVAWAHFDVYGWNPSARPAHPEGGEVQVARALFALIVRRYGGNAR